MANKALTFRLNQQSRDSILAKTGMSIEEIAASDNGTIHQKLSKKLNKKLSFDTFNEVAEQFGRGQLYSDLERLIFEEYLDKNL